VDSEPSPASPAVAPPRPPPAPTRVGLRARVRAFVDRVRVRLAWIRDTYCVMDPRTAGLFRIVIGFLCTADAIRHWAVADVFYSNDGVLTNHYHLFRPSSAHNFSFYHAFSSLGEVHVAFAIAVFCHLCFMVGWHARLFSVFSFILVTSLDNRLVMVENGGYVVVNLIVGYSMFLPIERRFSVDALLRSYRERRERTAADLNERYRPAWATDPFVSIGVLIALLNLSVLYFFNVVNKSGSKWRWGETVHYVLYLNRMVTGVAVFFRNILPLWSTRVITWSVLVLEALICVWIMAPSGRRVTRWLAIAGIWLLHGTFGIMMRLGPFSWFLIGWSFLLFAPEQWETLEAWARRRAAPRTVVYDRRSPLAFAAMRLLARLDRLELLRFEESAEDQASPPLLLVRGEADRSTGAAALREIARALPGGRYVFPVLAALSLGLYRPLFAWVEGHRDAVARFLGLTLPPRGAEARDAPSPITAALRRYRVYARETFLYYFAVCAIFQAIDENKSIPPGAKPKKTAFMEATIGYPRLYQGWGMFAPNPITDDGSITIDGRTIDGRRIDPFTGKEPDLDLTDADGLGLGQIQQDYFNRIRLDRNKPFRQGLSEYLRAWHLRTGRPDDELVAFDVYWVRDQCPDLHSKKPYANETVPILVWRKPGYRAPPELPPIPPAPHEKSAETPQPEPVKGEKEIFGIRLPNFLQ
jgi:hypothetical protein